MKELSEQSDALKNIVAVVMKFGNEHPEIYPIQDVMHCLHVATYWMGKSVMEYYYDSSDIVQDIVPTDATREIPTEPILQLKLVYEETERLAKLILTTMEAVPVDSITKLNLQAAYTRIVEAGFNTRMTLIAYEGLQSIRGSN